MKVLLKGYTNIFVSKGGYIYTYENSSKQKIFPIHYNSFKEPCTIISGREYSLLWVMMEAFNVRYTPSDSLKYTVTKEGFIPLSSIIVKRFQSIEGLTEFETDLYYQYKCEDKANAANSRGKGRISPIEIFQTLLIHNFNCKFCGQKLDPKSWQLDHYIPLGLHGRNTFKNIVPACRKCNIMKSFFQPQEFIKHCGLVHVFNLETNNNGHD